MNLINNKAENARVFGDVHFTALHFARVPIYTAAAVLPASVVVRRVFGSGSLGLRAIISGLLAAFYDAMRFVFLFFSSS